MNEGQNQEPSPLPPSGGDSGGRRVSLPGSYEFGGYGSAASTTLSPSASSGFVPAERLFQMQWQTINRQRRASMSDVNTSASGSGMMNSNMQGSMSLNQPFFVGTFPIRAPFPFAAMPALSMPMHSAVGPLSEATTLSRRMILESSSNATPVVSTNDPEASPSWGNRDEEQQSHTSENANRGASNGQEDNKNDDSAIEEESSMTLTTQATRGPSDRDIFLQSSPMMSLLNTTRSFCSSNAPQNEVRREESEECLMQRKEDGHDEEQNAEDEMKEEGGDSHPKPKRPLSAYNIFFRHERARFLQLTERDLDPQDHSPPRNLQLDDVRALLRDNPYHVDRSDRRHRKSHGKISFLNLVKHVSMSWKGCDKSTRRIFEVLAREEKARYKTEMQEYKRRQRDVAQQKADDTTEVVVVRCASPELKVLPANLSGGFFVDDGKNKEAVARNCHHENILKEALEITGMPAPDLDLADSPYGFTSSTAPRCLSPSLTAWADEIPVMDKSEEEEEEFFSRLLGNRDRTPDIHH